MIPVRPVNILKPEIILDPVIILEPVAVSALARRAEEEEKQVEGERRRPVL